MCQRVGLVVVCEVCQCVGLVVGEVSQYAGLVVCQLVGLVACEVCQCVGLVVREVKETGEVCQYVGWGVKLVRTGEVCQ